MPYGSVPTGNVLRSRGKRPYPGGPRTTPTSAPNPGQGGGTQVPPSEIPPDPNQGGGAAPPPATDPNQGGGGFIPPPGLPVDPGPGSGPGPRPFPPGYQPPSSPGGGPRFLGPPVFTGGGRNGPARPINPAGGLAPFPRPPQTIQPGPGMPNTPPPGGGRASPMTMPDGSTVWIWQGRVYRYDPTDGGPNNMGQAPIEDTAPQTPQGGQYY